MTLFSQNSVPYPKCHVALFSSLDLFSFSPQSLSASQTCSLCFPILCHLSHSRPTYMVHTAGPQRAQQLPPRKRAQTLPSQSFRDILREAQSSLPSPLLAGQLTISGKSSDWPTSSHICPSLDQSPSPRRWAAVIGPAWAICQLCRPGGARSVPEESREEELAGKKIMAPAAPQRDLPPKAQLQLLVWL